MVEKSGFMKMRDSFGDHGHRARIYYSIDILLAVFEYSGKLSVVEIAISVHAGPFEHDIHLVS